MKRAIVAGIATLALTQAWAGDASKNPEPTGLGAEAAIPFLNQRDSVRDWQANGQEGLWVQDAHKQWYYATTFAPCFGLDFAVQVGFKNRALNRLDRDSEIIVPDYGRCALKSLRKSSEPPPSEKRHSRAAKAESKVDAGKADAGK